MKTRGSWVRSLRIVVAGVLISGLWFLATFCSSGKHAARAKEEVSAIAAREASDSVGRNQDSKWLENYGRLPLSFEENVGQTAREVRYVSHGSGYELFLTPQEAVVALRPNVPRDLSPRHRTAYIRALRKARRDKQMTAIRLHLEGANPEPQIAGTDPLPTKVNYFIGNDPKKWHTNVPAYARVKYEGIYPGVDLVFYGNQRRLEYDFVVAPGADPKAIALRVEGARKMRINAHGDLVLSVSGGEVELRKPVVYQNVRGERREIPGRYVFAGDHRVAFAVGSYDRSEPLILDPVLNYSTYLGGSSDEVGSGIAVDASGNAVIAGQTLSTDFPAGTHGAVVPPPAANSGAAFVAELNPAGTQLLYSTYLAGTTTSLGDIAFAVAVDPTGKIYVTGTTFATNFPTTASGLNPGPLLANPNGTAFLTKLDPTLSGTSSLLYSTYLAGTGGDFGNAIAADGAGNAYIAGFTDSVDFPIKNPFQNVPSNAFGTAFLSRIDTTLAGNASLIYSTYLGGTAGNVANVNGPGYGDQAFGVAADSSHNAYVAGITTSADTSLTTASAFEPQPPAGNLLASAFVSKIDTTQVGSPTTSSLIYSTYLAGSTEDQGFAVALNPTNNIAYVTGTTSSNDFPFPGATPGAFDPNGAASGKAFVTLVDTTKSGSNSVTYSTYLGGTGGDTGFGIRADAAGRAYVAGTTASPDFAGAGTLKTLGAFQPSLSNAAGNAFVAKLSPAGTGATDLLYATYFGGNGNGTATPVPDQGFGIAIDSSNNAYITGQTSSTDLPVFSSLPGGGSLNGTSDAFVAKLTLIPTLVVSPLSLNFGVQPVGVTSAPQTVTLTNNTSSAISFTGVAFSGGNPAAANTDFASPSNTCGASIAAGASCTISVTFKPSAPASAETATMDITDGDVNSPQHVSLSGTGSATAPGVVLAPTSLSFGGQLLTTTSPAKTVTLTNNGNAALTINSIAASGDFAATSTGAGACPPTLPATAGSNTCTISVTFAPTAVGARTGTLTVTDNAGGSPHKVPLTGTGWDFTVTAPSTATVKAGQSVNFTVTMTPRGGFTQAVTIACSGAPSLATCTPAPASIAAADGVTAQTSTVTVSTTALMPPVSRPMPPLSIRQVVPLVAAGILLLLLLSARRPRMRLGLATATLVVFAVLAGCSGQKAPGTPKGTTNLTITGASTGSAGTVTKPPFTVVLTVN